MPKERPRRKRLARTQKAPKARFADKRRFKEASPDDIVDQLLGLFDHLGVHTKRLAARLTGTKSPRTTRKRIYPQVAAIGELLTAWHQDPKFLDGSGHPLPLKMTGARSFTSLAKKSVPPVDPKRLLAELERIGAVVCDSNKLIRVQMRSLLVHGDRRLATQHILASLHSFIRTLRHNLSNPPSNSTQYFHRVAGNGAFDVRDIPALKIRVKRHAQSFLELMDNWMARRLPAGKRNAKYKTAQVAIGVYLSVDQE